MKAAILSPRKEFEMKTLYFILLTIFCPKYVSDAINEAESAEDLDARLLGKR